MPRRAAPPHGQALGRLLCGNVSPYVPALGAALLEELRHVLGRHCQEGLPARRRRTALPFWAGPPSASPPNRTAYTAPHRLYPALKMPSLYLSPTDAPRGALNLPTRACPPAGRHKPFPPPGRAPTGAPGRQRAFTMRPRPTWPSRVAFWLPRKAQLEQLRCQSSLRRRVRVATGAPHHLPEAHCNIVCPLPRRDSLSGRQAPERWAGLANGASLFASRSLAEAMVLVGRG